MKNIVLASSSPRRKELMDMLDLSYVIEGSSVDESLPEGILPGEAVEGLAYQKAKEVAQRYTDSLVIGADTIVVVDDLILGKPQDDDDALAMILRLQGRTHCVYTGVAVIDTSTGRETVAHEVTVVEFRNITEEEALRYIKTGEPQGKAGSYAIQGYASTFVRRIEGDYFNVVGLPVFRLCNLLNEYAVRVF